MANSKEMANMFCEWKPTSHKDEVFSRTANYGDRRTLEITKFGAIFWNGKSCGWHLRHAWLRLWTNVFYRNICSHRYLSKQAWAMSQEDYSCLWGFIRPQVKITFRLDNLMRFSLLTDVLRACPLFREISYQMVINVTEYSNGVLAVFIPNWGGDRTPSLPVLIVNIQPVQCPGRKTIYKDNARSYLSS
jgi:hypothetical protein